MSWFKKESISQELMKSPEEFCKSIICGFKAKSSHNKNESMWCFWLSMGGALAAPIFVTLGDDMAKFLGVYGSVFILSKLIPSVLIEKTTAVMGSISYVSKRVGGSSVQISIWNS